MRLLRPLRFVRTVTLALATAALVTSCGGGGTPRAAVPGAVGGGAETAATVTIERSTFEPDGVTVAAGSSVEFVNLDAFDHTVTAADASPLEFDSGSLGQDERFTQQFDDAGTYDYFCSIHPTMRATVVVE